VKPKARDSVYTVVQAKGTVILYVGAARGNRGYCTAVQPKGKGDSVRWYSQMKKGILYGGTARGKSGVL
jgi:hypothetical protein